MLGMLGTIGSSLISGIGSFLGGQSNAKAIADANAANIAESNYLAGNSIRLKVADANAAGINPLAALGSSVAPGATVAPNTAMGDAMKDVGQDVGRAAGALMSGPDKTSELQQKLLQTQIDRGEIENMGLVGQLRRTFAAPGNPPTWYGPGSLATGVPLPTDDPRGPGKGRPNMVQEWWDPVNNRPFTALTREYAGTQFGPTSDVTGPLALPGVLRGNVGNVAPDVKRGLGWLDSIYGGSPDPSGVPLANPF
jgi:hypothetical protein